MTEFCVAHWRANFVRASGAVAPISSTASATSRSSTRTTSPAAAGTACAVGLRGRGLRMRVFCASSCSLASSPQPEGCRVAMEKGTAGASRKSDHITTLDCTHTHTDTHTF